MFQDSPDELYVPAPVKQSSTRHQPKNATDTKPTKTMKIVEDVQSLEAFNFDEVSFLSFFRDVFNPLSAGGIYIFDIKKTTVETRSERVIPYLAVNGLG